MRLIRLSISRLRRSSMCLNCRYSRTASLNCTILFLPCLAEVVGIEPTSTGLEPVILPLDDTPIMVVTNMLHFLTEITRRISCVWWDVVIPYVVQGVSPLCT